MDWKNTGYTYEVAVNVIHQTDVDYTLGCLSGVQLSSLSVTEQYYSDTRVQAKVSTVVEEGKSDGYIKNARLKIILIIPEHGWSEEFITGYVSDIDEKSQNGYIERTYTIEGTIWGLLNHVMNQPITIGKGAKLLAIFSSLLTNHTKMQFVLDGAQDKSFANTILYEPGTVLSTILFELVSGYNRMDVDGHGRIVLRRYIAPANKTPTRIIDYNDSLTLALLPLSKTSTEYESPGRVVVTTTISKTVNGKSVQEVICGYYDAPQTNPTSIHVRGWLNGKSESYSGISENPSKSELNTQAKKVWEDNQDKGVEWTFTSVFADYHAGEVVTLVKPVLRESGQVTETHKVLISTATTKFNTLTQELTLKEV